jgi:hypothetical protein
MQMHGLTGEKVSPAPPCYYGGVINERLRVHDSASFKTCEPG